MYPIFACWKAYPVDKKGVKSCYRGIVRLEHLENLMNLKESVRQQVIQQYPELQSCPILLFSFDIDDQEAA